MVTLPSGMQALHHHGQHSKTLTQRMGKPTMGSSVTRLKVVLSICSSALRAVLCVSGPSAPMAMLKDVRTLRMSLGV